MIVADRQCTRSGRSGVSRRESRYIRLPATRKRIAAPRAVGIVRFTRSIPR